MTGTGAEITGQNWMTSGVAGIGTAGRLADVGHEIPTGLLPSLLVATAAGVSLG